MKRIALLLLLVSFKIDAQEHFNWGLKEGISSSQVSGNTYRGFHKFGVVGGAFIKGRLKGNWTIALEMVYTEKGSRQNSNYKKTGNFDSYFLQLNYIEFPLLFQYHLQRISFELGPGYGFLTQKKEITTISGIQYLGTRSFNKTEINFNLGVSYTFSSRFGLNLRYTNSVAPVRKDATIGGKWYQYGEKNTVLALCLTYEFGKEGSVWK